MNICDDLLSVNTPNRACKHTLTHTLGHAGLSHNLKHSSAV